MTFHAPHSTARLVSLVLRRTLLSRTAFIAVGAVSTSVVLAARAPDSTQKIDGSVAATRSAIISSQLGLPDGRIDEMKRSMAISASNSPGSLRAPSHRDNPINESLYRGGVDAPLTRVDEVATLQSFEDELAADLESFERSTGPAAAAPKSVAVASLELPNDEWDALESTFAPRMPELGPVPISPPTTDFGGVDAVPKINGLETGPVAMTLTAGDGESLEGMLARVDLRDADRRATMVALRADDIAATLTEGDMIDIAVLSVEDNQLLAIRLRQLGKPPVELRWDGDTDPLWGSLAEPEIVTGPLQAQPIAKAPETLSVTGKDDDTIFVGAEISSSLYASAAKTGMTAGEIKALTNIFRYSIDFERDLRKGDRFEALFEKGKNGAYGDILYAKLTNRGKSIALYRGVDDLTGEVGYFDVTGKTNKRSLMRTPVAGAQVSSHFGMRHHPVLGYSKMHRGTDFRAQRGTPIFAAGDGIVDYLGRKGSYGKYIRIRHNGVYETAYAHLSRYAASLKNGDRVRQGDVIGYVGSTGRSTGPHLHFEILQHGNQINPLEIADFGPTRGLTGSALSRFKVRVSRIEIALTLMRDGTRVATAE